MTYAAVAPTQIRVLRPDDHSAVQALFERHGRPVRSRHGWDWALFNNPARVALSAPAGWVLTSAGGVVGFLGNIPTAYWLDGQRIWAATCTSYVVDEPHRTHSVLLMRSFAAQPGVSLVHAATANPHSAPVYRLYRFKPAADSRVDQELEWVANERVRVHHRLEQLGGNALSWLAWPAAPVLSLGRWLGGPGRVAWGNRDLRVEPVRAHRLAEEWDAWAAELGAHPGLTLDRSAHTLAWRIGDPDLAEDLVLLALRGPSRKLLGMCLLRLIARQRGELPAAELMDWAVLPGALRDDTSVLLFHAVHWARLRGAAVLRARRFAGTAADQLGILNPQVNLLSPDANWLLARDAALATRLGQAHTWSMTGLDGDDWFDTHRILERPHRMPWKPPWASTTLPPDFSSTQGDADSIRPES